MEAHLKITLVVENDQTESVTIDQGGDPVTVAPGQNATLEVLSTHPVTISVVAPASEEPETPADPVVSAAPAPAAAPDADPAQPAADAPPAVVEPAPPTLQGDTGAVVVPASAPIEVHEVANSLLATNTAIAEANVAIADAEEAKQELAKAEAAADAAVTDADKQRTAQALLDAQTNASRTAASRDAALDMASHHADTAAAAADKVQEMADDPDHPMTQDHADLAGALADNAAAAVDVAKGGDPDPAPAAQPDAPAAALTEDAPLTAVDGSTPPPSDLGDATASTPITPEDTAAAADFPPPSNETVITLLQGLVDNDAAQTEQGEISIPHLNAALVANGFAPIATDHPAIAQASAES